MRSSFARNRATREMGEDHYTARAGHDEIRGCCRRKPSRSPRFLPIAFMPVAAVSGSTLCNPIAASGSCRCSVFSLDRCSRCTEGSHPEEHEKRGSRHSAIGSTRGSTAVPTTECIAGHSTIASCGRDRGFGPSSDRRAADDGSQNGSPAWRDCGRRRRVVRFACFAGGEPRHRGRDRGGGLVVPAAGIVGFGFFLGRQAELTYDETPQVMRIHESRRGSRALARPHRGADSTDAGAHVWRGRIGTSHQMVPRPPK